MDGIAHFAHLGGMLFGLVLLLFWMEKLPFKPGRPLHR
jgi:membrane associated rhomboid family serine protease